MDNIITYKKWECIPWFGAVKVECQECHLHAVGDHEIHARAILRALLTDYYFNINYCTTCNVERLRLPSKKEDKNGLYTNWSLADQLITANNEINKLKESLHEWKTSWHEERERTGKLWWHHPAISSIDELKYYQDILEKLANNKEI